MKDVAGAIGVHGFDAEPRNAHPVSLRIAEHARVGQCHGHAGGASVRHLAEPVLHRRMPCHPPDEPRIAHQQVHPRPDLLDPRHDALSVHRHAHPGLAGPPDGPDRRGGIDAVHVQEAGGGERLATELLRLDRIGRRAAEKEGPLSGRLIGQHDADMPGASLVPDDVPDIDPFARQGLHRSPGPEIPAHLPDVASLQAQACAGGHGRGDDPAPLDVEGLELGFGIRLRVAVDDGDQVESVRPEPDDVERALDPGNIHHDLMAPAVMPWTT
ncbi:MAG: hypothetical protein H6Q85_3165 [candidate division NC10 bacterium]|nr:hypothetical protein [candidate division NC10 bacterium]